MNNRLQMSGSVCTYAVLAVLRASTTPAAVTELPAPFRLSEASESYKTLCRWYARAARTMNYDLDYEQPISIVPASAPEGQRRITLFRTDECYFTLGLADGSLVRFESRTRDHVLKTAPITKEKGAVQAAMRVLSELNIPHGPLTDVSLSGQNLGLTDRWTVSVSPPPVSGVRVGYGGCQLHLCPRTGVVLELTCQSGPRPEDIHPERLSLKDAQVLAIHVIRDKLKVQPDGITFGQSWLYIDVPGRSSAQGDKAPRYVWMLATKIRTERGERVEVVEVVEVDCFRRKAGWLP